MSTKSKNEETLRLLGKIIPSDLIIERDAIHIAVAPVVALEDLTPGQAVGVSRSGIRASSSYPPTGVVDPFLKVGPKAGDRFFLYLFPGSITDLKHVWAHPQFPTQSAELLAQMQNATFSEGGPRWRGESLVYQCQRVRLSHDPGELAGLLTAAIQQECPDVADLTRAAATLDGNWVDAIAAIVKIEGGKAVESFKWMEAAADELGNGMTIHSLLAYGAEYIRDGDVIAEPGAANFHWDNWITENHPLFWAHYAILTGIRLPDDRSGELFTCSC